MDYIIRKLKQNEINLLDTFLYEAIFIPQGAQAPSKDIIQHPDLQIYVADFGKKDDVCYVAKAQGKVVGAVWTRIINDYGHVDDTTPSLSISLLKEYRNLGIGTELMKQILLTLKERGYKQVSLSVQKINYALQFGTEIFASQDGAVTALLGASPGASTSPYIMLSLLEKAFPQQVEGKWNPKLHEIVKSYQQELSTNPVLLDQVRQYTSTTLGLKYTPMAKAANDETVAVAKAQ